MQDHLGGELLCAEVHAADGSREGFHYSNRLSEGHELDLTRGQFRDGQIVGAPGPVVRPRDVTRGRLAGNYALLSLRVARALDGAAGCNPVSVKAVCVDGSDRVLVCRNHRGGWELPGGRPELGEEFADTVIRELQEETGLRGQVQRVLGARALEVASGAWVDIVAYRCTVAPGKPLAGDEHAELAFLDPDALSDTELPAPYRELSAGRWCA